MTKRKKRNNTLILSSALLIIVAGSVFYFAKTHSNQAKKINPGPSIVDEGATRSHGSVTPQPSNQTNGGMAVPATKLAAPTLYKSSGNNGPVPVGALLNFVCTSMPGVNCQIILTDKNNTSNVITLPAQKVSDNGRGQSGASWDWTAVKGSWTVISKISDSNNNSAASAGQSLEVQ